MKLNEGISVADIADGSLIYKANDALGEVVRNILDPNTPAETTREITIKLKLKPNDRRDLSSVSIGVSTKLAATKPQKTELFLSQKSDGSVVVSERDTRQDELFKPEPPAPKHMEARREARQDEKDDDERT